MASSRAYSLLVLLETFVREGLRGIENSVNINGGNLVGFTEVFLAAALIALLIYRPGVELVAKTGTGTRER